MLNFKGLPVESVNPFDVTGEMGLDESLLDLPMFDLDDMSLEDVGLGAVKHRRLSAKTRRKLSRLAKKRSRGRKGRFAALGGKRRHAKKSKKSGKSSKSRKAPRGAVARGKRLARKMKRSKRGRFTGLKGLELLGLSGADEDAIDDMALLSATEGLGAARKRRRKSSRRKAHKARRHARRARRHSRSLSGLANVADGIGQVEVAASMPVVGAFQWLATGPGLEALGGVALAPVVAGLVGKLISFIPGVQGASGVIANVVKVAQGLVSSILMWEFGKLVGSANIAKFGAFYAIGRTVESMVTVPLVFGNLPQVFSPLGEVRIPDMQSNLGLILPDQAELVGLGTRRIADSAEMGQVMLPGVRRGDYAVNPLSGVRTTDATDVDSVGDIDDVEGEEEMAGAEESELF